MSENKLFEPGSSEVQVRFGRMRSLLTLINSNIVMNRWIVFWLLAPLLSVSAAGILTVSPNSADPGDTVSVTMALDGNATPGPPPSQVQPVAMSIGSIAGTSISRTGNNCTASFTIPANQAAGTLNCSVTFDPPQNQPELGQLVLSLDNGFTVNVDASGPPAITQDPVSQNAAIGGSVSFSVVATSAEPLSYQWRLEGNDLFGATAATYTAVGVTVGSAGDYDCVVTNTNGSTTSAAATLTVLDLSDPLERPYAIVDTAQRKFYGDSSLIAMPEAGDDFYGQDSNYVGNQPTYLTSADGKTVYDYHTGLTWTQTADLNGDGSINVSDKKTLAEAVAYVATLNAANFGGYNDWRLPTIKEIYSLMDFRGTDPTSEDTSTLVPFIDTDYFGFGYGDTTASPAERVIDAQMATTTLYVDEVMYNSDTMTGQAAMFGLNLADGRIKGYGLNNIDFYVFYVRGNTDYGTNDFEDNGDNTVTDHATGLMWQQDDSGSGMLWKAALAYAEASTHAGYDDWRLPNAKELQSLLDYSRSPGTTSSPAIDAIFTSTQITNEAGQADYPWYYTRTTHAKQDGEGKASVYMCFGRATGYMALGQGDPEWLDVHGAGAQRSELKADDQTGYIEEGDGWYFEISPQGDSARWYNYVRLVRDAPVEVATIYVNASTPAAAVDQDGTSWETAFADLQDGLATAVSGDEIWMAAGVYYPDEAEAGVATVTADDTGSSFTLIEGVSIYGGFDGTETERVERDWDANVTILSGDLDQNDTTVGDVVVTTPETNITGTNSLTVVRGTGTYDALLDGVTITAGYGSYGGGIQGAGTFRRCVIQGNYGTYTGGAYCESYSDDEWYAFVECDILANTGGQVGGVSGFGIPNFAMTSCRVQGNQATGTSSISVGGVHVGGTDAIIANSVISGNVGYRTGGMVMRNSGKLSLHTSTIAANYASETDDTTTTGGLAVQTDTECYAYNTIIWGNRSAQVENVYGITQQETMLIEGLAAVGSGSLDGTDPRFRSGVTASATPTINGDFRLFAASPAVDAGDDFSLENDTADLDEDGDVDEEWPYDLDGHTRVIGDLDMGAYELLDNERLAEMVFDSEDGSVLFDVESQTITGTQNGLVSGDITWSNSLTGANGTAVVAGPTFTISDVALDFGVNVITVTANNLLGETTEVTLEITRSDTFDGEVIYVDASTPAAAADQDGRSWESAFKHLQDALALVDGHEIRVAGGTYYPDEAEAGYATVVNDDRNSTFLIPSGVSLYGSYNGYGSASPDSRNSGSVLSGDLDQDDVTGEGVVVESPSDNTKNNNAYTVVTALSIAGDAPSVLDDFYITAGRADSFSSTAGENGGGLFADGVDGFSVNNCVFVGNYCDENGGAIYWLNSGAQSITNCRFEGNESDGYAAALYVDLAELNVSDCEFVNNDCIGGSVLVDEATLNFYRSRFHANRSIDGSVAAIRALATVNAYSCLFAGNVSDHGSLYLEGALYLENCTVAGNYASEEGAGIHMRDGSQLTVRNSIFAYNEDENEVDSTTAAWLNSGGSVVVYDSLIRGSGGSAAWDSSLGTDGGNNVDADPQFVELGTLSSTPSEDGDYRILATSPANNTGNNSYVTGSYDVEGDARIHDSIVDMGALEESHGAGMPELVIVNGETRAVASSASIDIEGTANIYVSGNIAWENLDTGDDGSFEASSNWTLEDVPFRTGDNDVVFTVENPLGTSVSVTVRLVNVGDVWFVDIDTPVASAEQNGKSWETAYADPQDAFRKIAHADAVWIAEGTYIPETGTSYSVTIEEGYVYGGFESGMTDVDSRDHETYPVVFDGDGEQRLIFSMTFEDMLLDGIEFKNAVGTTDLTTVGLLIGDVLKDFEMSNCSFSGLTITNGADAEGLAMKVVGQGSNGNIQISNCSFTNNQTSIDCGADGIGLHVKDVNSLTLQNTVFDNNVKGDRYGEIYGGALYLGAVNTVSIVGCDFTNNGGDPYQGRARGGAIAFEGATSASVQDCRFEGNYLDGSRSGANTGGAAVSVFSDGAAVSFERCEFIGNTFADQEYACGGALLAYTGEVTVTNSLFRDNTAAYGGAVYLRSGNHVVRNCTIVENAASTSGGGVCLNGSGEVLNSIVYDNTATNGANIQIIEDGDVGYTCTNEFISGTGNIVNLPLFEDAANDDFRIDISSPCVNAGANALWMDGADDLDGEARVYAQRVDMGAYEASGAGISEADTDTDGIGDFDELVVYGSDANKADSDSDGMDDGDELVAGTDLADASSILAVSVSINAEGNFDLAWPSVDGRSYTLRGSTDLSLPVESWDDLGTYSATEPSNVTEVTSGESAYFFRLEVSEEPRR